MITTIFSARVRRAGLGVTLVALVASGAVAEAATVSTTGAKAWNSGTHLAVQDTADDGSSAFTNWNNSGGNRVETDNGYGARAEVYVPGLYNFRACRNNLWVPDNCSGWKSA